MPFKRKADITSLQVTSGVKKQADTTSQATYGLVDLKGGGRLVALMKEASKTRNYTGLDDKIRELVEPFIYNKGEGKIIPVTDFILLRNKDRPKQKQLTVPKNSNSTENEDENIAALNGTTNFMSKDPPKYRQVCWDLYERGSVGETALHLCFLVSTSIHAELAKRLVRLYPKLVNDIYTGDEYYGEIPLHMAIVNEDPAMVKFLLDNGSNFHERCMGNFFCPEDQKSSRSDSLDHEWVNLCVKTNYEGYVYWGEYPLSFAACLSQEECYRLLLAKGADPNRQDTNGNTVLHMLVICDKLNMFNMAFELGAVMDIVNRQALTPLTLAAMLARKELRLVLECLTAVGAFSYLIQTVREARFLGYNTFMENLMTVPSRVLFLISCQLVMLMIPLRLACLTSVEDIAAVLVMLTTAPYFLFFCRGFKMVGPFVVMIYKMILTDLLCFVTIYLVFVLGFSQAFYVIFLSHSGEPDKNFFCDPIQSIMAMFVMSLSEFGDIYEEFDNTDHPAVAKVLFIVYMALVTILLINMLIAMMGKTYQDIAERRNEWMRQWARIVLVVERGVHPSECLRQQRKYTQGMADGRRALVLRLQQTDKEMEELRLLSNLKTSHLENIRRLQAGSNFLSPRSTPRKTVSTTSL
ncbi:transient receptor potential cation channel subfamily V member 6 [Centruroides vittatus]|uniref:transient receptor potential cation channel subfamily V member 6 n=1 Tax=Centruroides vittatus TaxID=120091 RepID=UPI00350ED77A